MTAQGTNPTIDYEIATSNRRLAARVIDLAFGFFVFMFFGLAFAGLLETLFNVNDDVFTESFLGFWLLLLIAYDTVMLRLWGKTLGKMALGLRVVDIQGEKLTWGRCIVRAIVLYLCGFGIVFLTVVTASIFGWIFMGGLARYKRFPQDSAAQSFVVRETKGELVKAAPGRRSKPTPLADLDRLYEQGMISKEEWERKKREMGN